MQSINLSEKFSLFKEQWTPKIIAMMDDNHVYLARIEGDFIWHSHAGQDELFLVIEGRFKMEFREREVWVEEGEMIVVPANTEHRPCAEKECKVLIIENAGTDHTGGIETELRKEGHERI